MAGFVQMRFASEGFKPPKMKKTRGFSCFFIFSFFFFHFLFVFFFIFFVFFFIFSFFFSFASVFAGFVQMRFASEGFKPPKMTEASEK